MTVSTVVDGVGPEIIIVVTTGDRVDTEGVMVVALELYVGPEVM